jgi:glycosyltransferase involved in cell wall biosynthesis
VPETLPITLYIPCYNGAAFLDRTLPAIRAQTHPIAELILVDDGSRDGSVELARRHGLRVMKHAVNRGIGAARNTAIRAAQTPYIAGLDADVRPRPDWLERLAAALRDGRFSGACGQLHETRLETLADRWRDAHMRQWWGGERLETPRFLYGNNNLYRREALLEVGLYDEGCRSNGEDVDISQRLVAAGRRLLYEPAAECDHLRQDTTRSICRTYWRWHFGKRADQETTRAEILQEGKKARRKVRKILKRDAREGRWSLVPLDLFMYLEWAWHDHRRAIRGPRRAPTPPVTENP